MTSFAEEPISREYMLEALKERQERHVVDSEATAAHLGAITMLATVGPTGSGKSTLIRAIIEKEPAIRTYLSSTTRPRAARDGDEYRTDVPLQEFYNAAQDRTIVNYYVHPNSNVYGTFASDFRAPITIGAISTASLPQLRAAPFRDFQSFFTVMDGDTYAQRLGLFTPEHTTSRIHEPDILARLQEGLGSIATARQNLGQPWFKPLLLSNEPGQLEDAAEAVIDSAYRRTEFVLSKKRTLALLEEMEDVIQDARSQVEAA